MLGIVIAEILFPLKQPLPRLVTVYISSSTMILSGISYEDEDIDLALLITPAVRVEGLIQNKSGAI